MNIIICDYESVWPKVWPQNKYRLLWPLFHGPVFFELHLEDYLMFEHHTLGLWVSMTQRLTSKLMHVYVTYISSSDFVLYLQDYLMHEWDSVTQTLTSK